MVILNEFNEPQLEGYPFEQEVRGYVQFIRGDILNQLRRKITGHSGTREDRAKNFNQLRKSIINSKKIEQEDRDKERILIGCEILKEDSNSS